MKWLSNPFIIFGIGGAALVYAFADIALAPCSDIECMSKSGNWALRVFLFCLLWWFLALVIKWIKQLNKK